MVKLTSSGVVGCSLDRIGRWGNVRWRYLIRLLYQVQRCTMISGVGIAKGQGYCLLQVPVKIMLPFLPSARKSRHSPEGGTPRVFLAQQPASSAHYLSLMPVSGLGSSASSLLL